MRCYLLLLIITFILLGCSSSGENRGDTAGSDNSYRAVKLTRSKTTLNLNNANAHGGTLFSRYINTYTVASGDTLYSIAWRVGIDVDELISLNNLHSPYLIHKGEILKLISDIKEKPKYSFQSDGIKKITPIQKNDKKVKKQCIGSLCT